MPEGIDLSREHLFNMAYEAYLSELEEQAECFVNESARYATDEEHWEALEELVKLQQEMGLYD